MLAEDESALPDEGKVKRVQREVPQSSEASVPNWVEAFLQRDLHNVSGSVPVSAETSVDDESDSESASACDDEAIHSIFRELEQRRSTVHYPSVATLQEQFRSNVIGGEWSVTRSGRGVYGMRCDVKRGSRIGCFCQKFRIGN
eukprot:6342138-Amphidinium_carterae.1